MAKVTTIHYLEVTYWLSTGTTFDDPNDLEWP